MINKESEVNIKKKDENILLLDFDSKEKFPFTKALEEATSLEWKEKRVVSNQARKGKITSLIRYLKYFSFPFAIFIDRKQYKNIIAWQQFYGLIYAFYCRLFHSKKYNQLIIMTFIYKEKKGFAGKIYKKFMKYIVQSKYIDKIVCFSKKECENYSKIFDVPKEKFEFTHLGVVEIKAERQTNLGEKTILSCGRSNRDYEFLYNALKESDYKVDIISDECKLSNTSNISVHNDVHNQKYFNMLANSYIVVIPLKNRDISSGQLVILQAMQLGKPIICTESNTASDYIINEENGFIIKKDKKELLNLIEKLYNDENLYKKISSNEMEYFKNNYSIEALGKNIGKIFNDFVTINNQKI